MLLQAGESNGEEDSDKNEEAEIAPWEAIAWLAFLTLWIFFLSGYLVDALQVLSSTM